MNIKQGQRYINANNKKFKPINILAIVNGFVVCQKIGDSDPFVYKPDYFESVFINSCEYYLDTSSGLKIRTTSATTGLAAGAT